MATIQTSFSISANKASATTTPGPMSVAISAASTNSLTVDKTTSEVMTLAYSGASDAAVLLVDGSELGGATLTGGTNGGYVYIKNTTASGTDLIYVGVHPPGLEDFDNTNDDATRAHRFMTLKRGEFAFFPFDYTQDISVKPSAASQQLEYWVFDRG
jgi:hypothetical protein